MSLSLYNSASENLNRWPAEWEPHEATWLTWPHNLETWPSGLLARVEQIWIQMVQALFTGERVRINVQSREMVDRVRKILKEHEVDLGQVDFFLHPNNDAWVRDHGPLFVETPERKGLVLDFEFNAWGGKYPPFDLDNGIPKKISMSEDYPLLESNMILEGGSVEGNGAGTLITTEACLLHPNRNPGLSREQIETKLGQLLGAGKILWLGDGIAGDDTDGHVDDMTRFVSRDTVVTAVEEDPKDPNYTPLQDNLNRLRQMTLADGSPLKVEVLPMPGPVLYEEARLPASYANFYIGNEVVIVPVFSDPRDEAALKIIQGLFPNRKVVGLDCREVVVGLGGIHCITQQQPQLVWK